MNGPDRLRLMISPKADVSKEQTGLTFTDILFGFVIFELFTRLLHINSLPTFVQWQLIAAATLVIGSWIGFRRSLNRSRYELKFFSLPLVRFALDQTMVILYFRIATLTDVPNGPFEAGPLVHNTLVALSWIFVLYLFWDLGALWMANAPLRQLFLDRPHYKPKYLKVKDDKQTHEKARTDWPAVIISAVFLLGILNAVVFAESNMDDRTATVMFIGITVWLLLYRYVKEVKTSFQNP